jgi:hypothetical protein
VSENRWVLLFHQIPPKPDYFRVKIWRRLQRIGAVAVKNSVYVLPRTDATTEDFQWLLREIVAGGGEASVCHASFVDGLTDRQIESLFSSARQSDYAEVIKATDRLVKQNGRREMDSDRRVELTAALARLRKRFDEVVAVDFFLAPGRGSAEAALSRIEHHLKNASRTGVKHKEEPAGKSRATAMRGRTWVTRRGVFVDRIASAWLIRQFIDLQARFKFVAEGYRPKRGELRFDMFEAEYTHEGDRCTFETLVHRFALKNPALTVVAEIVHDIDIKDGKFARPETAGVESLLGGLVRTWRDDRTRLRRGFTIFDDLLASLERTTLTRAPRRPRKAKK